MSERSLDSYIDSGCCETLVHRGWTLHVSLARSRSPELSLELSHTILTQHSTYSWEFITALDFEWSFIRGRRKHNWTIWVRSDTRIRLGLVAQPSSGLIAPW
jgi:hypothetical protein